MRTRSLLAVMSASFIVTSAGLAQQPVKVENVLVKATFTPAPTATPGKKLVRFEIESIIHCVPSGYIEEIGLGKETESKWVITPRELKLLEAANKANRDLNKKIVTIANPILKVQEGVKATFSVGGDDAKYGLKITSAGTANGIKLDLEVFETNTTSDVENSVKTSETVPTLNSLVIRGPKIRLSNQPRDTMIIITPRRILGEE